MQPPCYGEQNDLFRLLLKGGSTMESMYLSSYSKKILTNLFNSFPKGCPRSQCHTLIGMSKPNSFSSRYGVDTMMKSSLPFLTQNDFVTVDDKLTVRITERGKCIAECFIHPEKYTIPPQCSNALLKKVRDMESSLASEDLFSFVAQENKTTLVTAHDKLCSYGYCFSYKDVYDIVSARENQFRIKKSGVRNYALTDTAKVLLKKQYGAEDPHAIDGVLREIISQFASQEEDTLSIPEYKFENDALLRKKIDMLLKTECFSFSYDGIELVFAADERAPLGKKMTPLFYTLLLNQFGTERVVSGDLCFTEIVLFMGSLYPQVTGSKNIDVNRMLETFCSERSYFPNLYNSTK